MVLDIRDNYLKTIIILLLYLLGSTFCYAQRQQFTVGVKAGSTLSTIWFGDKDDKDLFTNSTKLGFFGAGIVNFPLKKNFSFQTEVGFSQRGKKVKFNEDSWVNDAKYHFIDGSMLLRKSYPLQWAKNVRGSWFFNVGPKVSYWLGGKGEISTIVTDIDENGNTSTSKGGSYDYKIKFAEAPESPDAPDFNTMYLTDVNRWLFGIDMGVGVDAPTTALQRFVFEVRFTYGHTFYGDRGSAFNRTLGFTDNLRANEKIISFSIDYTLNKVLHEGQKGKSTNKDVKKSKPRKNIDSMIH
jgi:hypothetical protein